MFQRLKKKWNVSPKQFWIIFIAFGCTGLTTAYLTKQIAVLTGTNEHTWWAWKLLMRIGMLLFGYQVLLLLFGALFGQWKFFWSYEKKLLQKLGILKKSKVEDRKPEIGNDQIISDKLPTTNHQPLTKSIAIFASGTGSNAEKIVEYFKEHAFIRVGLIACNKEGAGVLDVASKHNIPVMPIEREKFFKSGYVDELKNEGVDFIVLAGFLWKLPQPLISAYRNNIVNIHPALLPGYGGKGMYGSKVHEAVIAAGEKESGITIHYVDEHYDNGDIIFQSKCGIGKDDTDGMLAEKIHLLEHAYYSRIIEQVVLGNDVKRDAALKSDSDLSTGNGESC